MMFLTRKIAIASADAQAMVATVVPAKERSGNQALDSATNVWRVELHNLERILAMSSGDRNGTSELRYVKITLAGPDGQYHFVTEVNPFLSINSGSISTNNTINVRTGQSVFLERLEPGRNDIYYLRIHAKEWPQVDLSGPLLNYEIKAVARELDCARDRVFRRGSTVVITYKVSVPAPSVRSYRCENINSYHITTINGDQLHLDPMTSIRDRENVRSTNCGSDPTGSSRRLVLSRQSGEVSIAST